MFGYELRQNHELQNVNTKLWASLWLFHLYWNAITVRILIINSLPINVEFVENRFFLYIVVYNKSTAFKL